MIIFTFQKSIYFVNIENIFLYEDNLIATEDSVFKSKNLLLQTRFLNILK